MSSDYDSPWKEALDLSFEAFLALLFPEVHAQIDWSRPGAAPGQGPLERETRRLSSPSATRDPSQGLQKHDRRLRQSPGRLQKDRPSA
jgi:hypothetical protein